MAEEVFLLARAVRTFGTEEKETGRYRRQLAMLRRISIRQAAAYLLYLVTNASLFNLTKASRCDFEPGFACLSMQEVHLQLGGLSFSSHGSSCKLSDGHQSSAIWTGGSYLADST